MTVAPHEGSAVGEYTGPSMGGVEGLEDVDASDIILPRLQLVHKEAKFRDNLSKVEYPELKLIILGLIKQRIFWHDDTEDGDKPLCKSPDHEHGFPAVSDDLPKDKRFPWEKGNFRPEDYPPGGATSMNGLVTLPCQACIFKEWDKNGWKVPPCAEQHTYAVLYLTNPNDPVEDHRYTPALITFQKTGIKPSKNYISSFMQAGQPMFTVYTTVTLNALSRGAVDYAVPSFKKGDPTDRDMWAGYGTQFRTIREFVRQPPRSQDDDEDFTSTPASNENTAPAAPPAPAAAAPPAPAAAPPQAPPAAAPSAPVAPPAAPAAPGGTDDSDLPF